MLELKNTCNKCGSWIKIEIPNDNALQELEKSPRDWEMVGRELNCLHAMGRCLGVGEV